MAQIYLWLKALHLISMVAWFAGLFYIFRLFVYHIETQSREVKDQLAIMEQRLIRLIMNPAMIATLLFGMGLAAFQGAAVMKGWFFAKMGLVAILMAYHMASSRIRKQLAAGTCQLTSKLARLYNELPTVLLIVIVILAVVKPF